MTMVRYGKEVQTEFVNAAELYKKAIIFDKDDIGKLTICSNETLRHYISKAILVYLLKRMKHRVVCEAKISGIGYIDVFDIDTNVMYEIETEKSIANIMKKKEKYNQVGVDLVVIQIRNWNDDIGWLTDYIKMWIRPD